MGFEDRWLVCVDCGREFLWDAGEQAWYHQKKLDNAPRHCRACRERRRDDRSRQARQHTQVHCTQCGARVVVPFVPHGGKPVYCRACYDHQRR